MNGHISRPGVIVGEDGKRYSFGARDVKNLGNNRSDDIVGMHVNFSSHGDTAGDIFLVKSAGAHAAWHTHDGSSYDNTTRQFIRPDELKLIKKFGLLAALVWLIADLIVFEDMMFKRFLLDTFADKLLVEGIVLVLAVVVCFFFYRASKHIDEFSGSKLAQDMRITINCLIFFILLSDLAVFVYTFVFHESISVREAGIAKLAAFVLLSLVSLFSIALSSWYYFKWNRELTLISKDGLFMASFVCGFVSLFFIYAPTSIIGAQYKFVGDVINVLAPLFLLVAFARLKEVAIISQR